VADWSRVGFGFKVNTIERGFPRLTNLATF
jgi:hypothetical protein